MFFWVDYRSLARRAEGEQRCALGLPVNRKMTKPPGIFSLLHQVTLERWRLLCINSVAITGQNI